ncbi:hypothetical protein [Arenimonas alkanexedens]
MRQDQIEKLQALSEQLTDVFLFEANPKEWPGEGLLPRLLSQEQRGDRYWSKKNAVATMAIVVRIESLTGRLVNPRGKDADEDADSNLDAEISAAEKEGTRLLEKVLAKSRA